MEITDIAIVSLFKDTSKISCVYRFDNVRYKRKIFLRYGTLLVQTHNVTAGSCLGSTLDNMFKCILD